MESNKSKKILFLTNGSFPIGFALTNRILSYCKEFLYHGNFPEVICIRRLLNPIMVFLTLLLKAYLMT